MIAHILHSRSFARRPVLTLARGFEWIIRANLGYAPTISIKFGPGTFKMRLPIMKQRVGSVGIFVEREYYEPLLEFGHKFLSQGDRIIDGGANQGIFSCAFGSAVGPSGVVYAFEPQSYAVNCLRQNAELNGFENIRIFEAAVSDCSKQVFLNLEAGPVSAAVSDIPTGVPAVKACAIDDLITQNVIEAVQFIKLDLEGHELNALKGAKIMLAATRPIICLEVEDRALYECIEAYLSDVGYKAYVLNEKGELARFRVFYFSSNVFFLH